MNEPNQLNVTVRSESPADEAEIRYVNQEAFGSSDEAALVDALRDQGFARVSLVAESEGRIVGHILFSALQIVGDTRTVEALALAPMAVLPPLQSKGFGSRLVRDGLSRCRDAGHRIVLVVGHPEYYPRFGFSRDLTAPLQCEYAGDAFMALELTPGALDDVKGEVRYPPPFAAF